MDIAMNTADAITWLAYATKLDALQIMKLELHDDDLKFLGYHLSRNKLLNPPKHIPVKTMTGRCATCGQGFIDQYKTKKPIHCHAHQR